MSNNNQIEMDQLSVQIMGCELCPLHQHRKLAVPGVGPAPAELFMLSEAPGYFEDQSGQPFMGPAGGLLNELLKGIGIDRIKVFITNTVKCRPPENREPLPNEILACDPYLQTQLRLVHPRVIVAMGAAAFHKFNPHEAISRAQGKPRPWGDVILYPTYHPAAALHNPRLIGVLEQSFKLIPELLTRTAYEGVTQPVVF